MHLIAVFAILSAEPGFQNGLVVSVEPNASRIGMEVMKKGGNAVDAAVATAFALAVTHPEAGNIGGGGFLVIRDGKTGKAFTVDFREKAPALATPTMFLDEKGNIDRERAGFGWWVVGVPGSPSGLWTAHQRAGKLPWKDLVEPAIKLAREGFVVDKVLNRAITNHAKRLSSLAGDGAKCFLPNGKPPEVDSVFKQPDLAHTLELIRDRGPDGFYEGETAELIDAAMRKYGGLVRKEDLADYSAVIREPLHGKYRGYEIIGMPPPSSGGVALIEMLNILEGFELPKYKPQSAERFHLSIEAMKLAFHDRARYLGDTDFSPVPLHKLISREYATERRKLIDPQKATASRKIGADILTATETSNTTHFSVMDSDGTMVACTTTLEDSYGSHVVAPGTGFLLNNEMHDFNLKPGYTDTKGNIGTTANVVAPRKRMLSSMTPTLVVKDGKPFLVLGSPGGRTIINTVLCVLTNVIDYQMPIQEAVDFGRIHHQWMPDEVRIESRLPSSLHSQLKEFGHRTSATKSGRTTKQGDCHAIQVDPTSGRLLPGVDKRIRGAASGY